MSKQLEWHRTTYAFVGDRFKDLYVTTAEVGLDKKSKKQPLASSLFVFRSRGHQDLPTDKFKPI